MKALAITSTVVLGLIAIAIGWFAIRADPMGGEPVVVIAIDLNNRPASGPSAGGVPDVKEIAPLVPLPSSGPVQQTVPSQAFSGPQMPVSGAALASAGNLSDIALPPWKLWQAPSSCLSVQNPRACGHPWLWRRRCPFGHWTSLRKA